MSRFKGSLETWQTPRWPSGLCPRQLQATLTLFLRAPPSHPRPTHGAAWQLTLVWGCMWQSLPAIYLRGNMLSPAIEKPIQFPCWSSG